MNNPFLKFLFFYILVSSVGWLFAYMGISGFRETRKRRERETAAATGRVIALNQYRKRSRSSRRNHTHSYYTYWRAVVEFEANGRMYRLEAAVPDEMPAVGETVELRYDPDDPTRFHLKGVLEQSFRLDRITTALGALWIILSVFLTIKSI